MADYEGSIGGCSDGSCRLWSHDPCVTCGEQPECGIGAHGCLDWKCADCCLVVVGEAPCKDCGVTAKRYEYSCDSGSICPTYCDSCNRYVDLLLPRCTECGNEVCGSDSRCDKGKCDRCCLTVHEQACAGCAKDLAVARRCCDGAVAVHVQRSRGPCSDLCEECKIANRVSVARVKKILDIRDLLFGISNCGMAKDKHSFVCNSDVGLDCVCLGQQRVDCSQRS